MLDQTGYLKKFIISETLLWVLWVNCSLENYESLYVGEAQTRFHPLPLPQSRARDRLFWGYFR